MIHRLSLLIALATAVPAAAQTTAPVDTARIDRFVHDSAMLCAQSASTALRIVTSNFLTDVRRPGVSPADIAFSVASPIA